MTVLEIFIFRGETLVGSRVFSDTSVTIGRGNASMLVLDDRQVSRLHATIEVEHGPAGSRLLVRDNNSQVGTRLNGKPVTEAAFGEADTLEIGTFRLKVTRRSMRQHSDFDEEEPTDAGHLRRPVAPSMQPSERATMAPRGPQQPVVLDGGAAAVVRVTVPAVPAELEATRLPDSPADELTAGVEDALPELPEVLATAAPPVSAPSPPPPSVTSAPAISAASAPSIPATPATSSPSVPVASAASAPSIPAATPVSSAASPAAAPALESTPLLPVAPPVVGVPNVLATSPASEEPLASAATPLRRDAGPLDWHEDDEDDEEPFVPSFSLLQMLDQEPPRPAGASRLQLEIIHHRDGQVLDVKQLRSQASFAVGKLRLLRHAPEGKAQLTINESIVGRVFLGDREVTLEELRRGTRDRQGVGLLELREGDRAEVSIAATAAGESPGAQPERYHVRFVRQPAIPRSRDGLLPRLRPLLNLYLLAAVLLHGSLLYGLSKLPSPEPVNAAEDARFAEVSLKQIQLEPPPEVKPPEPPEPEVPPPPTKEPVLKPSPKVRPVVRARVRTAARPAASPDNALAALEMIKPADTSGPALKDVVSNISAVSVPADTRSRFRVGGAIGKLPTGEVRLSTAGVARDATSARELLTKGGAGALKGAGGSGDVRGVVKQTPPAALQAAGSGRLSRAQIQKVINEHVAQIQGCYERNLVRDRSLAGKITFDWVIAPSGSVASVRVRSSTMAGSAVSTCILQEIRGWVFPTPEGGSVSVTYPFIFSAQGY